jgi:hypothetical protein
MSEHRADERHVVEAGSFVPWLRRLWPIYCLLAVLATFGYALYDSYQIDGDAVAYMDIADLLRTHQWAGAVNAYWNPLYPAMLAMGQIVFHTTRYTELHAFYIVNFAIFLLEMVAVVTFTDSLVALRSAHDKCAGRFFLERYALRYLGVGLLIIATQRELSMGKVRPDALLQALILLGLASLLRYLATGLLRYAGAMGAVMALAYLTKSFGFLLSLLCMAALVVFRWLWTREKPLRLLVAGVLAAVCFALLAGPYVASLSKQKGRFDFGDSGALNYAWFVGGTEKMHLQPYQTSQFGSAEVHLKHPEKELMREPPVFSYRELPYGTYPDWFDATYWNDSVKPHQTLRGEIPRAVRDVVLVFRYLLNHPEGLLVFGLLLLLGARLGVRPREVSNAFWVPCVALGLCIWGIYGIVNIEERYVTVGYFAILLPLAAALRERPVTRRTFDGLPVAPVLVLLFAFLAAGESTRVVLEMRRQLSGAKSPGGWYDASTFNAAKALNAMGVGPGDSIACIGTRACLYDHYWARLAGVRILTEIYVPEGDVSTFLTKLRDREKVMGVVRQQGDKVLVGFFQHPGDVTGGTPATAGWHELGDSSLYQYPLNTPVAAAAR